jgi:hypothetical protein
MHIHGTVVGRLLPTPSCAIGAGRLLTWCLSNALWLETYVQDADRDGDSEVAEFFRQAQAESRQSAEQGKQLLGSRLSG